MRLLTYCVLLYKAHLLLNRRRPIVNKQLINVNKVNHSSHCDIPRHDNNDCGDDDGDEIEHGVDVISDGAWLVFPLQSLPLKKL